MDDQAYLEPSFDPSSLTVPRLRSILVAHNVNYPSSAKKGQLIDLFNEHVVPQASKIRAASLRVKRTSRGIVDMPASQGSTYDDENDEEEVARAPRSGRRTRRARTEEAQEVMPTPRTRHSTAPPESLPRRASSKHARTVEDDEEAETRRPVARKSRLSAQTPIARVRDSESGSPFSSDNVFQSGSSGIATEDRRRVTTSALKDDERRRSSSGRRRTEDVKPIPPPSRRSFTVPESALKKRPDQTDPGEEFTPEEQMELVQSRTSGDSIPVARRKKSASKAAQTGLRAVALAVLGGVATLYSQEKFQVGYCGEGYARREIAGVAIPEWADVLRPRCEPCPPHATCGLRFETTCDPDFVLVPHPLTLNGKLPVPLPPTCEPDSAKAQRVQMVKERAIIELREHNAKYECGEPVKAEMQESVLKAKISSKRASRMGDREFEELWASAIGEVREANEVVQGADGSAQLTLRSTSLASLPLSCAVRRSLREALRQYLWELIETLVVVSSIAYGYHYITSGRKTEERAKQLAGLTLDKLSQQASLHAQQPDVYRENYISMAQLRDDVLRTEWSTWNKKKLWDEVQKKVEKNSNVRPMVREGRSGDVGRVWEWVGAVSMIESPEASNWTVEGRRRKSGRVSFGGERWIEPSDVGIESGSDMSEIKKWEDRGKHYY